MKIVLTFAPALPCFVCSHLTTLALFSDEVGFLPNCAMHGYFEPPSNPTGEQLEMERESITCFVQTVYPGAARIEIVSPVDPASVPGWERLEIVDQHDHPWPETLRTPDIGWHIQGKSDAVSFFSGWAVWSFDILEFEWFDESEQEQTAS